MDIPDKDEFQRVYNERFPKDMYIKLKEASVVIVGLGGLGSNIAVNLARSCVGKLKLVDFDRVELSNLNRQVYDIRHLNMKKTEALKSILKEINPYIEIEIVDEIVDENNVYDLVHEYNYVCEAVDRAQAKAMLINNILLKCTDTVIVSGSGMAGYKDANNIGTRKINEKLYICGDLKSDIKDGMGLMAPRVSICAGHQANKVIELILQDI